MPGQKINTGSDSRGPATEYPLVLLCPDVLIITATRYRPYDRSAHQRSCSWPDHTTAIIGTYFSSTHLIFLCPFPANQTLLQCSHGWVNSENLHPPPIGDGSYNPEKRPSDKNSLQQDHSTPGRPPATGSSATG